MICRFMLIITPTQPVIIVTHSNRITLLVLHYNLSISYVIITTTSLTVSRVVTWTIKYNTVSFGGFITHDNVWIAIGKIIEAPAR